MLSPSKTGGIPFEFFLFLIKNISFSQINVE